MKDLFEKDSMSIRVIFAGTPDFSVPTLEALINSPEIEVVAVYTQPDRPRGRGKKVQVTPIKAVAETHNIPVVQPLNFRNEADIEAFKAFNADLMVVVAYGIILPKAILEAPKYGCLNIHASLLPRWRGAAPIHRAIEAGDAKTGVGIMQMDVGLDTGDVWSEASIDITDEMTTGALHDALKEMGAELLLKTIPAVIEGKKSPTPQPEEGVTYAEKISREEAEIDWTESRETLLRKIHAFNPVPGAFTHLGESLVKVFDVRFAESDGLVDLSALTSATAGTLCVINKRLFVKASDGVLEILTIQAAGRRRMETEQFLQGNDVDGEVFN